MIKTRIAGITAAILAIVLSQANPAHAEWTICNHGVDEVQIAYSTGIIPASAGWRKIGGCGDCATIDKNQVLYSIGYIFATKTKPFEIVTFDTKSIGNLCLKFDKKFKFKWLQSGDAALCKKAGGEMRPFAAVVLDISKKHHKTMIRTINKEGRVCIDHGSENIPVSSVDSVSTN